MKVTSLRPLSDRVAVRPDDAEAKIGNILLPDQAQARPRRGTVVAVGPGRYTDEGALVPMRVRVGDRVLFSNWGEYEQTVNDEQWFLLRESDIYGVIGE